MEMYIRLHNQLMDLSNPRVMAIINFSPDSFFTSLNATDEQCVLREVEKMLTEGADILDIGACSTRPGSTPIDANVEWELLQKGLDIIRHHWSEVPISVDTFRADIAAKAIAHGADMINDVSGGNADPRLWEVVAQQRVPYVLTHAQTLPAPSTDAYDYTMSEVLHFLQERLDRLHRLGIADVIIDPGFGFGKTVEQNYSLLHQLDVLQNLNAPMLVGLSRKSMLYKPLQANPNDVLPATIAAQTLALERGAHILRVHDVAAAVQAIHIHQLTHL